MSEIFHALAIYNSAVQQLANAVYAKTSRLTALAGSLLKLKVHVPRNYFYIITMKLNPIVAQNPTTLAKKIRKHTHHAQGIKVCLFAILP